MCCVKCNLLIAKPAEKQGFGELGEDTNISSCKDCLPCEPAAFLLSNWVCGDRPSCLSYCFSSLNLLRVDAQVVYLMPFGFPLRADRYVPAVSDPLRPVPVGREEGLRPSAKAGSLPSDCCSGVGDSSLALRVPPANSAAFSAVQHDLPV